VKRIATPLFALGLVAFVPSALAAPPHKGTCGMFAQVPNDYVSYISGNTVHNLANGESEPANMIAVVDFGAKTINYSVNVVTNHSGSFDFSPVVETASFSSVDHGNWVTLTLTTGSFAGFAFNFLPVNNDSMFYVQGAAGSTIERLYGVCQKQ